VAKTNATARLLRTCERTFINLCILAKTVVMSMKCMELSVIKSGGRDPHPDHMERGKPSPLYEKGEGNFLSTASGDRIKVRGCGALVTTSLNRTVWNVSLELALLLLSLVAVAEVSGRRGGGCGRRARQGHARPRAGPR